MDEKDQLNDIALHLAYLFEFARQMNELDFAVSLNGEARGMQDAGWATTITANEVFDELIELFKVERKGKKSEFRILLMLYCQLAEAGGVYEGLKNIMGIVQSKPYVMWPFRDLVRVKEAPKRIIGPNANANANANATFRDLAVTAKAIGLTQLGLLLETIFRDDIRNGISHADYVIWSDGLRLRKRNGGYAEAIPFEEVNAAISIGCNFFQVLREYNAVSVQSYNPPRTILGRFSANFPMPWTVAYDPEKGTFSISGSSPGQVTTPESIRQERLNSLLGGKVLALYGTEHKSTRIRIDEHILMSGFEPNCVDLQANQLSELLKKIEEESLWDNRNKLNSNGKVLLLSPWGFRWLASPTDFDQALKEPSLRIEFE